MDREREEDRRRGRMLHRREALALLGTSAGVAFLVAHVPRVRTAASLDIAA